MLFYFMKTNLKVFLQIANFCTYLDFHLNELVENKICQVTVLSLNSHSVLILLSLFYQSSFLASHLLAQLLISNDYY